MTDKYHHDNHPSTPSHLDVHLMLGSCALVEGWMPTAGASKDPHHPPPNSPHPPSVAPDLPISALYSLGHWVYLPESDPQDLKKNRQDILTSAQWPDHILIAIRSTFIS